MIQINRTLLRILIFVLILAAFDRAIAYIYIPSEDNKKITLYSTEWCSYCSSLRMYLDAHGITYKEYDVEQSAAGLLALWAFRARGVPVVVVGNEVIYGYDMRKITIALNRIKPNLISTND